MAARIGGDHHNGEVGQQFSFYRDVLNGCSLNSTLPIKATEQHMRVLKAEVGALVRLAFEQRFRNCKITITMHSVPRQFVYRHFVYYCIPACRTVIHPTSVSENYYFHQFQLLLTL